MGRNKEFWQSKIDKGVSFSLYYDRLIEIAASRVGYEDLPGTIDERFMELWALTRGRVLLFRDDVIGDLAMPFNNSGGINYYREPINRTPFSTGYNGSTYTPENSVIMYNNYLRQPSLKTLEHFADMLSEIDMTIKTNVSAQKTPILIACDENQLLSLKNLYQKFNGGEPVIFSDKNIRSDTIKVLSTGAPYVAGSLYELKVKYWNEALTYLGIANIGYDKRERMITDEVQKAQGGTIACVNSVLVPRAQAWDKYNKMNGTKVKPYLRNFTDNDLKMPDPVPKGEIDNE